MGTVAAKGAKPLATLVRASTPPRSTVLANVRATNNGAVGTQLSLRWHWSIWVCPRDGPAGFWASTAPRNASAITRSALAALNLHQFARHRGD